MAEPRVTLNLLQHSALQINFIGGMAFFLYPDLVIHSTDEMYWLPIVAGASIGIFGSWLYSKMMSSNPGKDLFEISIGVVGRGWTMVLLFPLVLFMFNSIALMARSHAEMVNMTMLPTTPQWFLNGLLIIPLWSALGGITSIVRTITVLLFIALPFAMAINLLGLVDLEFSLGSPWFKLSADFIRSPEFYASSYVWVGFIYCSVIGKYASDPKHLWKSYGLAVLCFLPMALEAVLLPVLTFGPEFTRTLTFPYIMKMDSIDIYWLPVENLTAIYVSVTMIFVVGTVAMMYFCVARGIHRLFPRFSEKIILWICGGITYSVALLFPSWLWVRRGVFWDTPLRLFLAIGLPVIYIALIWWKKRKER